MEADQGKQGFAPPAVGVLQQGGSDYPFEKPFFNYQRGRGVRFSGIWAGIVCCLERIQNGAGNSFCLVFSARAARALKDF